MLTYSGDNVCPPDTPHALLFLHNLAKYIQQEDVAAEMLPGCMAKAAGDELPPLWSNVIQIKSLYLWEV